MDYRVYRCNGKEQLWCVLVGLFAGGIVSQLFYRSWYGMVSAVPIWIVYRKFYQKEQLKKQKEQLLVQFKDAMQTVSAALLAGYSVENAWRSAEKELVKLHGEHALLTAEFRSMNVKIGMHIPMEELLLEFAGRSGCEDIESFAGIFAFAKRSGGDFVKIIRITMTRINGKIEVDREIATVLAGKKLEGRIMSVIPFVLLAYLNTASGDFISVLYQNTAGVLVMSGALLIFAAAAGVSERITDIKV